VRVLAGGWFEQADWSPDGDRLVLVRNPSVDTGNDIRIATFDLRAHRARTLRAGWHPGWSPDGGRIVFVRGIPFDERSSLLFVMNADGSGLRPLTR
jgi:Tol biopolymer transport system component